MPKAPTYEKIALSKILIDDKTYQFRSNLKFDALVESIKSNGLKVPVILRPSKDEEGHYQIICGFRRVSAYRELNKRTIPAIVQDMTDREAYKASIIENEQRDTYNDLDRGRAILRYKAAGHKIDELIPVFKVNRRQLERLQSLDKMDTVLKDAIESGGITTTTALVLHSAKHKYDEMDLSEWVEEIVENNYTVGKLKTTIEERYGEAGKRSGYVQIRDGQIHFNHRKIHLESLSKDSRETLKEQLQAIIDQL